MQPASLALRIYKGATFRARLRVMQPELIYKDIATIEGAAPVRLSVAHGLPTDWPVWIEKVQQFPALNRAPIKQAPHSAFVVDADTLEINSINGTGLSGKGGQIIYHPPLPLVGATATLTLYEKGAEVGTLPVTVDAGGWVDIHWADEVTDGIEWTARDYALDIALGSGDVLRVYQGSVDVVPAGALVPGTAQGYAVLDGNRGPAGPSVASALVDMDGRLVITLEDGTEVITDPINRPWGSIQGNIAEQADLMAELAKRVPVSEYDQFTQSVASELSDRALTTDPRLSDSRTPTGAAGGVLSGTYPNPGFAVDMATQAELNAGIATRTTPAEAAAVAPVQTVQGRTGDVIISKADLSIEHIDNTSDADKPVSGPHQLALNAKVSIAAIVDNLTSADPERPLSANQGRVLKQLVDNIETLLASDNINLDTLQEIVEFIELNRATLDTLGISNIAGLQSALDGKADQNGDYANLRARSTTAADVGLGSVNNTADSAKPVSTAQQTAFDTKVDKVTGKQLSTEDYTAAEKAKLGGIAAAATANATDAALRDRATHTGTQAMSTVAGLQGELDSITLLIGDASAALDAINGEVI